MSGLRLSVTPQGNLVERRLAAAARFAQKPDPASRAAADWVAGETFRIFSAGYTVDGPWAPLSKMTLFIRRHRANAPRAGSQPGSDTGRLKGSFLPFTSDDGREFGAGTNVEYAEGFGKGLPSKDNTVAIAGFRRRNMKRRMRDYVMHLKGGHPVPPRPFFPSGPGELASWGYLDKVREIFRLQFENRLGGASE